VLEPERHALVREVPAVLRPELLRGRLPMVRRVPHAGVL